MSDNYFNICACIFLTSIVILIGYIVHRDYDLSQTAIRAGYTQTQNVGGSGYHWVKGK